jgi:hypothetical protein
MALTLHASYPDYGRKKQVVFKAQVERTFKELKDSLGTKRKRSQGQQRRTGEGQVVESSQQFDIVCRRSSSRRRSQLNLRRRSAAPA